MDTIRSEQPTTTSKLHGAAATTLVVVAKVAGLVLGLVMALVIYFASIFGDCLSDDGLDVIECSRSPLVTSLWVGSLLVFGSAALMMRFVPSVIAGAVYFASIAVVLVMSFVFARALVFDHAGITGQLWAAALVSGGLVIVAGYWVSFLRHMDRRAV